MPPLGVTTNTRTAPAGRGAFTLTGTAFVAGQAAVGSALVAKLCQSIADFEAEFGARAVGNQALFDWVDTFFSEGGVRVYVGRYTAGAGNFATACALLFPKTLGPGQVACAGSDVPDATLYAAIADFAVLTKRVGLLDVANADTVAAMTTKGGLVKALTNDSAVAAFGPWCNVPAPRGVIGGASRTVHASAVIAALCQRVESLGNPNRAAAGPDFPLQYVTSFVDPAGVPITETQRETLLNAGINTFANLYGVLQNYGFQTGVDQSVETPMWQFNVSRAIMWLQANADVMGQAYMFDPLDAQGRLVGRLKTDLDDLLKGLWDVNGLYGATPAEAFAVNTSASVNTSTTVASGELHGVAEIVPALHVKSVVIDLVTVPITGRVSAAA